MTAEQAERLARAFGLTHLGPVGYQQIADIIRWDRAKERSRAGTEDILTDEGFLDAELQNVDS